MGKFTQGINGPFSGRVGNVIGSNWRGIHYMKSVAKKSTKERSPKQKANQFIFAMTMSWLQPLTDFVREGFRNPSSRKRGFSAAKSYLHANALVRDGYDSYIIPSQMLISKGTLPRPAALSMTLHASTAEIDICWNPKKTENPADGLYASYNDQLMYVFYNVEEREVVGEVFCALRMHGQYRISLDPNRKAKYHVYAAFHSADRKNQSDSCYLGEVEVG